MSIREGYIIIVIIVYTVIVLVSPVSKLNKSTRPSNNLARILTRRPQPKGYASKKVV